MSLRRALALAIRIIRQFLHDPRTLALLFIAPLVILALLQGILSQTTSTVVLAVTPQDTAAQTVATDLQASVSGRAGVSVLLLSPAQATDQLARGDVDGVLAIRCPSTNTPTNTPTSATSCIPAFALTLEGSNPAVAKQLNSVVTLLLTGVERQVAPGDGSTSSAPPLSVTYLHGGADYTVTDAIAPFLISFFSFFLIFLLTGVAFLRERTQGTMERILVSPLRRSELVVGYILGFTLFALAQALLVLLFVVLVLQVHEQGNLAALFVVTALSTLGGLSLGIAVSAFARNEYEIGQFIPLLIVPQLLLGGLFFPVKTLPTGLKQLAEVLPLTHANDALSAVMLKGASLSAMWGDLAYLGGFALLMLIVAAFTLRQERV
jgi:ABC-2 type transport system permease protein